MADTTKKYKFLDYEGLALFWNNVKKVIEDNELVTTTALTNLNSRVEILEGSVTELENSFVAITTDDIKGLFP